MDQSDRTIVFTNGPTGPDRPDRTHRTGRGRVIVSGKGPVRSIGPDRTGPTGPNRTDRTGPWFSPISQSDRTMVFANGPTGPTRPDRPGRTLDGVGPDGTGGGGAGRRTDFFRQWAEGIDMVFASESIDRIWFHFAITQTQIFILHGPML